MTRLEKARQRLEQRFKRNSIADLDAIKKSSGMKSRTSVFRMMQPMGYLTSCSHAGSYYTIPSIPVFDDEGLWFHGNVLFSKYGTLRATLMELIERSPAGLSHAELKGKLRLKTQDTLRQLTNAKKIGRVKLGSTYVYVSANKANAHVQQDRRRQFLDPKPSLVSTLSPLIIVEVLSEVIRNVKGAADSVFVSRQLRKRGVTVTAAEVEHIFDHHGVKKTAPSRSQRSRR